MNNDKIKRFHSVINDNTSIMANIIECSLEEETQNYITYDFIIKRYMIKECLCDELRTIYDSDFADELDKDLLAVYFVGNNGLVINTAVLLSKCQANNIYARISSNYLNKISMEFERVSALTKEL